METFQDIVAIYNKRFSHFQGFGRTGRDWLLSQSRFSSTSIFAIKLPGMTMSPTNRDVMSALLARPVALTLSITTRSVVLEGIRYSNELDRMILLSYSASASKPFHSDLDVAYSYVIGTPKSSCEKASCSLISRRAVCWSSHRLTIWNCYMYRLSEH